MSARAAGAAGTGGMAGAAGDGRTLHHVGFTVRDLAVSVPFYEWLGFAEQLRWSEGPDQCQTGFGVEGAAVSVVQLLGYGMRLELIQWDAASVRGEVPPPNQVGSAHLGVTVEDIDAFYDAVKDGPWEIVSPPQRDPSADWLQVVDPDGIRVEIICVGDQLGPDGAVYR
ncbi:MAG: VOC family protein [Bifidobacteriaceae bacterium]|jgi:catechol 2,3-dioxygenase-like lactoylglutathione lyase family enzyme|nr:VOC family protein [Bifidobacteriaceae bacterium]